MRSNSSLATIQDFYKVNKMANNKKLMVEDEYEGHVKIA